MATTKYGLANGFNTPTTLIEDEFKVYTRGRFIPPQSQPIDRFPVRTRTLSQRTRGGGVVRFAWTWSAMPAGCIAFLVSRYWQDEAILTAQLTVRQRIHRVVDLYEYYNCHATLPSYTYEAGYAVNVRIEFEIDVVNGVATFV